MKLTKPIIAILNAALLSGCGATHFNKRHTMTTNDAVFVDAKQRGIYQVEANRAVVDDKKVVNFKGICAEPSPDAISSLATALGVELSVPEKGKLGVSNSISEAVGNIGMRTAAIQALRDMMYRNCEAYALGAVSEMGLETLQRRFQTTMVAILAIEQLTGAVKAPAITLTGESSLGDADAIIELTNKSEVALQAYENAKDAEKPLKKDLDEKKAKHDETDGKIKKDKEEYDRIKDKTPPLTPEETKLKTEYEKLVVALPAEKSAMDEADKAYKASQTTTEKKKQAYDAIESARLAALTAGGKTSTSADIKLATNSPTISDETASHISTAVVEIVKESLDVNFGKEVCTTLIGQHSNLVAEENTPLWHCMNLLLVSQSPNKQETIDNILSVRFGKAYTKAKLESESIEKIITQLSTEEQLVQSKWHDLVNKIDVDDSVKAELKKADTIEGLRIRLKRYAIVGTPEQKAVIDKLMQKLDEE